VRVLTYQATFLGCRPSIFVAHDNKAILDLVVADFAGARIVTSRRLRRYDHRFDRHIQPLLFG
jgi:hypothetical protein